MCQHGLDANVRAEHHGAHAGEAENCASRPAKSMVCLCLVDFLFSKRREQLESNTSVDRTAFFDCFGTALIG